ncbi:MAG: carbohydrate kinase family protein [Candidatus Aenigmarchaeota archaeon]|nr:carbohydrate kinase family protein [Candidatus Aenigmarchaeota archaeon]
MPRYEVVGIGTPTVDVLVTKDGIIKRFGGSSVISAITALSRWGAKTAVISRVGKDTYGDWLIRNFEEEHVDVSGIARDSLPTSIWSIGAVTSTTERAEPQVYRPLVCLSAVQKNVIQDSDAFLIRINNPLFPHFVEEAAKNKKRLFVTFHLFEFFQSYMELLRENPPEIIFMNDDEYEKALEHYDLFSINSLFVVMKGEAGCILFRRGDMVSYHGYKANSVDTTGSEGCFVAGFLYGYLRGWPSAESANLANVMRALATTEYGGRRKLPTTEEMQVVVSKFRKAQ